MVPKVPVFNCTPPPYAYTGTGEQSHKFISKLNVDHHATTYLLQVEGMEYGQHTAQSQQPASEKILNTSVHHFASGH